MRVHNNYLQVCQCNICQAHTFETCGGGKEFQAPLSLPVNERTGSWVDVPVENRVGDCATMSIKESITTETVEDLISILKTLVAHRKIKVIDINGVDPFSIEVNKDGSVSIF